MIMKRMNPIVVNEMRTRMRGRRAVIILTLYLSFLGCVVGSLYNSVYDSGTYITSIYALKTMNMQNGPNIGKTIFAGTSFLLLIVVSHIAPAFTAAAISGERERQTYEVLLITPLPAKRIVWGKLGAVFLFLLLMIATSLPLQSLAFLFGGVTLMELFIATLMLLVTALSFGALGLYISCLNRTTMTSIIFTYTIVLPFLYGMPFLVMSLASFTMPFVSLIMTGNFEVLGQIYIVIMAYCGGFLLSLNPFSAALLSFTAAANGKGYFFFTESVDINLTLPFISPWIIYVFVYSGLTIILTILATKRLQQISNY